MLLPIKVKQFLENIIVGYLTIPLLMTFILLGLAIGLNYLEEQLFVSSYWLPEWLHINSSEQISTILMTIASASVTVVSVTFSITMLTLSLAANQLGARLLPNFMHQTQTQWVIGLFVGIFVFEVVSATLVGQTESVYQNSLTLLVGILLGIVGFFTLLYFIHFVSKSIQLNEVLRNIQLNIANILDTQYPDLKNECHAHDEEPSPPSSTEADCTTIFCQHNGYVQAIDYTSLSKLNQKYELQLRLQVYAGQMVFRDTSLAYIVGQHDDAFSEKIKSNITRCFYLNSRRSITQDLLFAFEQLSEIAVKALSPGEINCYTAISCLDYIAAALLHTSSKDLTQPAYSNPEIQKNTLTASQIIHTALDRLCRAAANDHFVVTHCLDSIRKIIQLMNHSSFQHALITQMQKMLTYYQLAQHSAAEKEIIEKKLKQLYPHSTSRCEF